CYRDSCITGKTQQQCDDDFEQKVLASCYKFSKHENINNSNNPKKLNVFTRILKPVGKAAVGIGKIISLPVRFVTCPELALLYATAVAIGGGGTYNNGKRECCQLQGVLPIRKASSTSHK